MLFFYSEISVVVKIVFPFYTGDKGGFAYLFLAFNTWYAETNSISFSQKQVLV